MMSRNKTGKPWIDKMIKAMHRKKRKLYNIQRVSVNPDDRRKYLEYKAETQRQERKAYWRHVQNLIEIGSEETPEGSSKQKRFWKFIKAHRK